MDALKYIEANFKMFSSRGRVMLLRSPHLARRGKFQLDCEMWSLWTPEGLTVASSEKYTRKEYAHKSW